MDATNEFLIVTNYMTGSLALLPINPDGTLEPLCDLIQPPGSPDSTGINLFSKQGISHPHHALVDPTGRFIVVPDLGVNKIFVFTLDTVNGKFLENDPSFGFALDGSGPRHVDFHPILPNTYVVNELGSTVSTYHFDFQTGKLTLLQNLSTLPESVNSNTCAEITVSPSGQFLYVSNRGHNSISIFAINQDSGLLSPVALQSTLGKTPRFIALDPLGRFLYAANEESDNITTFRVNESTGKLTPTEQILKLGSQYASSSLKLLIDIIISYSHME